MKKIILAILILAPSIYAQTVNPLSSIIVNPASGSTISTNMPIFAGIVRDTNNKPVKNKKVTVCIDNTKICIVATNNNGVWSYYVQPNQILSDGFHTIQAYVEFPSGAVQATKGNLFKVKNARTTTITRYGNVSAELSTISSPYEGAMINTAQPTIVGVLYSAQYNPVPGETVQITIDGTIVGTATSDNNGMFSYTLSAGQALSDGPYTIGAHCVQTNVNLTSNNFTIDTTPPAAPTITSPTQDQIMSSSPVTVSGTTENDAVITTYMDGNTFGDISYADKLGNWSIDYDVESGDHSVTAQATDLAGNQGDLCAPRNFSVS
jgi:hypothetical protein